MTAPRQRGYDAACRSGEYLGADRDPECPYPDDTADSIDWLAGYREGASAMEYVWPRAG
jgi:ribosome modulation factor